MIFGVGAIVFLALTVSEYAPIAERLLQQDNALDTWIHTGDQTLLSGIRSNTLTLELNKGQDTVPNDSLLLLMFSLVLDAAVIFVVDEK